MLFLLITSLFLSLSDAQIHLGVGSDEWIWTPIPHSKLNIRKQHWITYHLRAPSDAYVGLQKYDNSTDGMIAVFMAVYGWQCGIKPYGILTRLADETCPVGLLSGQEFRPFWISWKGGWLAAGRGAVVGEDVLMAASTPYYIEVQQIVINGYNIAADFIIDDFKVDSELYFGLLAADAYYNPDPRMLTSTEAAPTATYCSIMCLRTGWWCRGFSYKSTQQECRLFMNTPVVQSLTPEAGWETWKLEQ